MTKYESAVEIIENKSQDYYLSHRLTYPYLLLMTICILLGSGYVACHRPLWYDEIVTYYITLLPSSIQIIKEVIAGTANNSPLDYVVRHLFMQVGGDSPLSLRFFSVLMFIINGFFLYRYVSFRIPSLPATVAFLFPVLTLALHYSFEARFYAPLLAWAAMSLYFWQQCTQNKYKSGYLILLFLSLSLGSYTHLYGMFNYVPIFLGEVVRLYNTQNRVYKIMAAILLSAATNVFLYPFIINTARYSQHFWTDLGIVKPFKIYISLLPQIGLFVAAVIIIVAVLSIFFSETRGADSSKDKPAMPVHELVATVAVCLFPFFMYIAAILVTNALDTAYCIVTVNGLAILTAYGCHAIGKKNYVIGVILVSCLMLLGTLYMARTMNHYSIRGARIEPRMAKFIESVNLPIAMSDGMDYLYYYYYLPKHLKDKVVFPIDEQYSIKYIGYNTIDVGNIALSKITRLNLPLWNDFIDKYNEYYIVTENFEGGWLIQKIREDFRDNKVGLDLALITDKYKVFKVQHP